MCCCVMAARKAGEVHRNALVTQRHKFVCGGSLFASKTLALSSAHCKRAGAGLLVVLRHGCRQLSLCSFELGHGQTQLESAMRLVQRMRRQSSALDVRCTQCDNDIGMAPEKI